MSTAMMQAQHTSDSEDEDAGQVPELLNTIKSNIDAHDALDQMPADKYDEAAEKIFKETGDYLRDQFMKPDHTDFSQGAMDARKNKEEAAYNLFIFLRFFRFFTFANACNYVRDSILSSGSELIKTLNWHDPDDLVGAPEKELTLYDDDCWPTQHFFLFLFSNIKDDKILFVKKGDTKPLSFQANVCNTGVDGSPGIQTQLSGVTSALKKIVTDPGIMTGSLTVKDDARVMVIKSQKTVAGESHIVFKVMSLYDVIENCGSWGALSVNHAESNKCSL